MAGHARASAGSVMATALAEGLCAGERSDFTPAAGALVQWIEHWRAKALRTLPKAWTKFAAAPAFWSLAQAHRRLMAQAACA